MVSTLTRLLSCGSLALGLAATVRAVPAEDAFLDDLQARTFRWFWEQADPGTGLVPDRTPQPPFSSVAAVGFGLTAYGVGVERGLITRAEATERVLKTLRFLAQAPTGEAAAGMGGHRGFFYHFLELGSGHRYRTCELSSIDTALLVLGALFCQQYFQADTAAEAEIRRLAETLYRRVEWDWMLAPSSPAEGPLLRMAWRPEAGFSKATYQGLDEAMFLYVLAIGSPTHPAPPETWNAFTRTYQWGTFHGQDYAQFTPLFGYQYAHVWIDPRGLQDPYLRDRGIDCFEQARRATYANRAYCAANPGGFRDYSGQIWGLTACDGPANVTHDVAGRPVRFRTYYARGASLRSVRDDGTLAPTAAGGSVPFAPEITIPTLAAMRARYGDLVYNQYGFIDAFNPTYRPEFGPVPRGRVDAQHGWFATSQLGIDQGPILLMIENHRSGLIWRVMRENPHLRRGLLRAGFTADWLRDKN